MSKSGERTIEPLRTVLEIAQAKYGGKKSQERFGAETDLNELNASVAGYCNSLRANAFNLYSSGSVQRRGLFRACLVAQTKSAGSFSGLSSNSILILSNEDVGCKRIEEIQVKSCKSILTKKGSGPVEITTRLTKNKNSDETSIELAWNEQMLAGIKEVLGADSPLLKFIEQAGKLELWGGSRKRKLGIFIFNRRDIFNGRDNIVNVRLGFESNASTSNYDNNPTYCLDEERIRLQYSSRKSLGKYPNVPDSFYIREIIPVIKDLIALAGKVASGSLV